MLLDRVAGSCQAMGVDPVKSCCPIYKVAHRPCVPFPPKACLCTGGPNLAPGTALPDPPALPLLASSPTLSPSPATPVPPPLRSTKLKEYLSTKNLDAGTTAYIAPECFMAMDNPELQDVRRSVTDRTDVYALGAWGRHPLQTSTAELQDESKRPPQYMGACIHAVLV